MIIGYKSYIPFLKYYFYGNICSTLKCQLNHDSTYYSHLKPKFITLNISENKYKTLLCTAYIIISSTIIANTTMEFKLPDGFHASCIF